MDNSKASQLELNSEQKTILTKKETGSELKEKQIENNELISEEAIDRPDSGFVY